MVLRRFLQTAALLALMVVAAGPAGATVRNDPTAFLADPAAVLDPASTEVKLRIETPGTGILSDLEIELDGNRARLLSPPSTFARGRSSIEANFAISKSRPPRRLVARYRFNGESYEQSFDLSPESEDVQAWRASRAARIKGTAADGRSGRVTVPSSAQSVDVHVYGRILATRASGSTLPVDSARVEVMDANDQLPDTLLGTVWTDPDGAFDLNVAWPVCPTCDAQPDIYLRVSSQCNEVRVVSALDGLPYAWVSPLTANAGTDVPLGDMAITSYTSASAFSILNTLVKARRWSSSLGHDVPPVECNVGGTAGTHYSPSTARIELESADKWKQWVIVHEYGHHWQFKLAPISAAYTYTNGVCDSIRPSHCFGCAEMDVAAWIEGFADWFSTEYGKVWESTTGSQYIDTNYPSDFENWLPCTASGGMSAPPEAEESHVAALLNDLADVPSDDSDGAEPGSDRIAYGAVSILAITKLYLPNRIEDLYRAYLVITPGDARALWRTALNNQMDFDRDPPAAPVGLTCTDHTAGFSSPDATLRITWTRPPDDGSGVAAYSILISQTPNPVPSETDNLGDVQIYITEPLSPGVYYVGLRAMDWSGHWGPTANAGPYIVGPPGTPDLLSYTPPGWHSPCVPRQAADGTPTSVPMPTTLLGYVTGYVNLAWANFGTSNVPLGTRHYLMANGAWSGGWVQPGYALEPGYYDTWNSLPFINFPGGLHTMALLPDGPEVLGEASESNNIWGEQWALTPYDITNQGPRTFLRPAQSTGGASDITDGAPVLPLCLGYQVSGSDLASAVTLRSKSNMDVDLRHHPHYSGTKSSYQDVIAESASLGDLDAILMPENSPGVWDFSAVKHGFSAPNDSMVIHHVSAASAGFDVDVPAAMTLDQSLALFTTDIPADAPATGIFLSTTSPKPLRVALLSLPSPIGLANAIVRQSGTDELGAASIINVAAAGNRIAYAVYREADWGSDPVTFTVRVRPIPPDPQPMVPAGWHSPLVPLADASGTDGSVPAPASLPGDVASTYLNAAVANGSPSPAPQSITRATAESGAEPKATTLTAEIRLDGAALTTLSADSVAGGGLRLFHLLTPFTVRGGRHVLSSVVDPANLIAELDEGDNVFGEAWVWTPTLLAIGATTSRTAPPPATGGWSELTASADRYPNCDGLRMPPPVIKGENGRWLGFAAMPGGASSVFLTLHEASTGAQNGFAEPLVASQWGTGESDYVLANFRATSPRSFDVGVVRGAGDESYTAQVAASMYLGAYPSGLYGPFTIPNGSILALYEVWLPSGQSQVVLQGAAGAIDWGLSLHVAGSSFLAKQVPLNQEASWLAPAGSNETAIVTLPDAGHVLIAVWKSKSAGLDTAGSYWLNFHQVTAAEPSARSASRLGAVLPNPSRDEATIEFQLERTGLAELAVYDVRGAQVRVLEKGILSAGRHIRAWDGRGDDGASVATGVYLVRLTCGGARETKRVAWIH